MPFAALLLRPIVIISILLLLSLGSNVVLFKMWKSSLAAIGVANEQRDQALAAGQACSDGVVKMRDAAAKREKALKASLAVAAKKLKVAEKKAQETLQMEPSIPGDLCASSLELSRMKIKERVQRILGDPR